MMKSLFLAFSFLISSSMIADDKIVIHNAWMRLTPPVVKSTAVYFSITNHNDETVIVTGVTSKIAGMSMMHDVVEEDGMTAMVHLDVLEIHSGETKEFRPGARHVMLTQLNSPLKLNADVVLTLQFMKEPCVSFTAKVLKSAP